MHPVHTTLEQSLYGFGAFNWTADGIRRHRRSPLWVIRHPETSTEYRGFRVVQK